jgi:hypothetical protein
MKVKEEKKVYKIERQREAQRIKQRNPERKKSVNSDRTETEKREESTTK